MNDQEVLNKDIADMNRGYEALTEWKNEPSIKDLKEDLTAAKSNQGSNVTRIKEWIAATDITGSHKPEKKKGRSAVQPRLIRKQLEWRIPALSEPFLGSQKLFDVSPVTFEDKKAAEENELLLNWQFRTKLNKTRFIDKYVRNFAKEGTVIIQVGWERTTKPTKEEVPVFEHYPLAEENEEEMMVLQQVMQYKEENIRGYNEEVSEELKAAVDYLEETGEPTVAVQVDVELVDSEEIIENKPTVLVHDAENIYIDPTCNDDVDKALFIIRTFEVNHAELQKQTNVYKNLDKINWDNVSSFGDANHETKNVSGFEFKDKTRKKGIAYEYWGYYDIHDNGELTPIVATWIGDTLIRMEENPFPGGWLPFIVVPYVPIKNSVYGEPDAELLTENQAVLGALSRGMMDLMGKSANSQQGFVKGFLDPLNRRKFEAEQHYEFNPIGDVRSSYIQHTYPEIPNSALTLSNHQHAEAESLTGVKAFHGGISGESYGKVATGIRGALDAAGKREMSILRRLAEGIKELGTKIIAMNSVFLSEEEVVRVTNDKFVGIRREDLAGNFDLKVDISTAEVDEAKAQDLGFMLQTIGPNIDTRITMKILSEIAKLKRMPELANDLGSWEPEPDPIGERMRELEVEKAELMNERIRAEIEQIRANAGTKEAEATKMGLELEAEMTGLKHERDMERIRSQAESNQQLEITKALTRSKKLDEIPGDVEAAIGYNSLSRDMDKINNL